MSRKSTAKRLGICALVATAGLTAATASADAATCSFSTPSDPNRLTVQMTANNVMLQSRGGLIFAGEVGSLGSACASRSVVSKVVVRSANPAGFDQVVIDEGGGKWGSLPLIALTGSGNDSIVVNGSNGSDHYTAMSGLGAEIDLDGDLKTDFRSTLVGTITLNGSNDFVGGSAHEIIGLGGPQFTTTSRVDLRGQAGDDTLVAGWSGHDLLDGGLNNDKVVTSNGLAGDFAAGGEGFDFLVAETGDTALGFESGGIGGAEPATIRVGKGRTAVELSWKHPVAWSKLGKLILQAYAGGKRVGTVELDPASGVASDSGGLHLVGHSPIAHKGRTVSTTLELRVGRALAGKELDLRMQPRER